MATYICRELDEDDPASVFAAVPRLQWKLLEIFESGRTVVLMIDEAQLLPPETLEFLRLLSNFETDREKLVQIVLVGQPELDNTLVRRDMRQVSQRVALRARLAPLSLNESVEYIEHRLLASGADDLTQILSPSAAWRTARAAGGRPPGGDQPPRRQRVDRRVGRRTAAGRRLARRGRNPRFYREIRRRQPDAP